jgi:hypothetical protein
VAGPSSPPKTLSTEAPLRDTTVSAEPSSSAGVETLPVAAKVEIEIYRGFRRGRELERKLLEVADSPGAALDASETARYLPGLEPVVRQAVGFLVNSFVLQSGMFFPPTVSRASVGSIYLSTLGHPLASSVVADPLCGSHLQRRALSSSRARREAARRLSLARSLRGWRRIRARSPVRLSLPQRGQHRPTYPADAQTENSSDTRYVDVSKLGDERISGLKDKLGEVVKDVNMNRPSVLILDGLENLAGVDLPVRPR